MEISEDTKMLFGVCFLLFCLCFIIVFLYFFSYATETKPRSTPHTVFAQKVYIKDSDTGLCYIMGKPVDPYFSHSATSGMAPIPCNKIPAK